MQQCKVVAGMCAAPHSRLTRQSVFDLSIRAQTLAMWPLTLALCEGHAKGQGSPEFPEHRRSSTPGSFWSRGCGFTNPPDMTGLFSLSVMVVSLLVCLPQQQQRHAVLIVGPLKHFWAGCFMILLFSCAVLFQQAIIFTDRIVSSSWWGSVDGVKEDIHTGLTRSTEYQNESWARWGTTCTITSKLVEEILSLAGYFSLSVSHGAANGFYFHDTMLLQSYGLVWRPKRGHRREGVRWMQHMISTWGCRNSQFISKTHWRKESGGRGTEGGREGREKGKSGKKTGRERERERGVKEQTLHVAVEGVILLWRGTSSQVRQTPETMMTMTNSSSQWKRQRKDLQSTILLWSGVFSAGACLCFPLYGIFHSLIRSSLLTACFLWGLELRAMQILSSSFAEQFEFMWLYLFCACGVCAHHLHLPMIHCVQISLCRFLLSHCLCFIPVPVCPLVHIT